MVGHEAVVAVLPEKADDLLPVAVDGAHDRNVEVAEGQPDGGPDAGGGDPPDLGRRGASLVEVPEDVLDGLLDLDLVGDPLGEPGRLQGSVEEDGGMDVCLLEGREQHRHELHHVVPLATAAPVFK